MAKKGNIGVSSENIFPIIKKFLYSDHDIFLREIIANAVDATKKLLTLHAKGGVKGELGDLTIRVAIDKNKKTLTISDKGIGMNAEEVERYINQIACSGAEDFLEKYKDDAQAIIGHFGLGFYSSFMVSEKVEIASLSYAEGSEAIHWQCDGSPEYSLQKGKRSERGTDIIMHINEESKEFLEEARIQTLLEKYCRFLPIEIAFGTEKEWKDGKEIDTGKPKIINETKPLWMLSPSEVKEENYKEFYQKLYPMVEEPLFHIHINVDYPFKLTGILYFPIIRTNFDVHKNKIQLYCNQVFVTDSVENIVPDFLTLLHGVIDSPDIPLNVSRSYLQSDSNVKKISGHISKKVADKLHEIFKADRKAFEEKWQHLKLFIEYGILSDEKFYDRAKEFFLFADVAGNHYAMKDYEALIKGEQTDKDGTLVYLYAEDKVKQYSYIEAAQNLSYNVLLLDGHLTPHLVQNLEQKLEKSRFVRVDSDVPERLILKEDNEVKLSASEREDHTQLFSALLPEEQQFIVDFNHSGKTAQPIAITQNEFMRRMQEMSKFQSGSMMNLYGEMKESFNLIINMDHPLIYEIIGNLREGEGEVLQKIHSQIEEQEAAKGKIDKANEKKKSEEISEEDKTKTKAITDKVASLRTEKNQIIHGYAKKQKVLKQLIDLALLSNNMLQGKDLSSFVKQSIELLGAENKV